MPRRKDDELFSLGWGTPEQAEIGKPLEEIDKTINQLNRKVSKAIEAGLKQAAEIIAGVNGKVAQYIAMWCEECRVGLQSCDTRVFNTIEDKLACVRFMLDQVCDKCPEAARVVWGEIGDILPPSSPKPADFPPSPDGVGEGIAVDPITNRPAIRPIAPRPTLPPTIQPPIQPGEPQPIIPGQPLPVQPVAGVPLPPNLPIRPRPLVPFGPPQGPMDRNAVCIVHSPISNCRHCVQGFAVQAYLDAGSVLVGCGYDWQLCGQIVSQWNATSGCGQFPGGSGTQPPSQPPTPPSQPGMPTQCVVCNQCQPTPKPCPKCEKPVFCAWRTPDSLMCYILPEKSPPLDPSHIKMKCSDDISILTDQIRYGCQPKQTPPSTPTATTPGQAVGINSILCHLLAYDPSNLRNLSFGASNLPHLISQFLGGGIQDIDKELAEAEKDCDSINPIKAIPACFRKWWLRFVKFADDSIIGTLRRAGCTDPKFVDATGSLLIVQFLEKWIAGDLPWITTPLKYAANELCPVTFPSVDAATQAFLTGQIDYNTLLVWVRQNGYCTEPWNRVVNARQARLSPEQATAAYRRSLISEQTWREQIRGNGYLHSQAPDVWFGITRPIPPISDIIRMMVRDVEDSGIVAKFGLDDLFTSKWQGQLRDWGLQQGIDDEIAKRYYRAHWAIPSPTKLFEMFHRSRGSKPGTPGYIDYDTVREALIYQDIAPFWIEPLLSTTYSLLRLVDIRRAYEINAIDTDVVYNQMVKRGLSDDDALVQTNYYVVQKQEGLLRDAAARQYERGELTMAEMAARLSAKGAEPATIERIVNDAQPKLLRSRPVKLFEQWQINETEVRNMLNALGARPETIESAVFIGRRVRFKPYRKRCLDSIRKRFLTGEFDEAGLRTILVGSGASASEADELVPLWVCEKAARGKEFTASMMCGMMESGLLTPLDMWNRLQRIGYSADNAALITAKCQVNLDAKRAKEMERINKERERAEEKAKRALERQIAAANRAAAKEQSRIERLNAAREAREKRLETATQKLVELTGASYDDAGALIRQLWQELTNNYTLSLNERVHIIVTAIQSGKPSTLAEAEVMVTELADEGSQLASVSEQPPESGNGEAIG